MAQYIAKSCGSKEVHEQHIHVLRGTAYACFGYTPPVSPADQRAEGDDMLYPTYNIFGEWE